MLGEVEDRRRVTHPSVDLALLDLGQPQGESHVGSHCHVRVKGIALEDHRDVPLLRRQVVYDPAPDPDGSGRDLLETGQHPQRSRLAAARRPDEDHQLAIADRQVDVLDRLGSVRIPFRYASQLDLSHRQSFRSARGRGPLGDLLELGLKIARRLLGRGLAQHVCLELGRHRRRHVRVVGVLRGRDGLEDLLPGEGGAGERVLLGYRRGIDQAWRASGRIVMVSNVYSCCAGLVMNWISFQAASWFFE